MELWKFAMVAYYSLTWWWWRLQPLILLENGRIGNLSDCIYKSWHVLMVANGSMKSSDDGSSTKVWYGKDEHMYI